MYEADSPVKFRVENLVYGGFGPVLFEVSGGSCLGVFGESGCGKTRLLRSLADLDPHEGDLFFNNINCEAITAPQWRRSVGYLPAESQWWFDFVSAHFKVAPDAAELSSLGLSSTILDAEVSTLSSGEKQRLALLRLLGNQPSVLLLDEVTAHLDGDRAALVEKKIGALMRDQGLAVVWISHDIKLLRRICSRILLMKQGGVITGEERPQ